MSSKIKIIWIFLSLFALSLLSFKPKKPVIYIIGDSTVRNNHEIQRGWGSHLSEFLDTSKVRVDNQAMAGRSTRTFIKEGRWGRVDSALKKGDYVFMQFGHNEGSVPDTSRGGYRGVLPGTGDEVKELVWPDGTVEIVYTYGRYIQKFIRDTKAKGAIPVVVSMIPRNRWKDGKVERANKDFGKWAEEVASKEGAFFIDLNKRAADKYDNIGPEKVATYFHGDHTHTNVEGAKLNAETVVEGIKDIRKLKIRKYLKR